MKSPEVKMSYIVVSRNDSYCGDSVGRLQHTLNHTGSILSKKNKLEESEVILTDWASPVENGPLVKRLDLNDEIKSIIKIVEVPPDIANKHQKDSPFSEVHAMNVGFRKSCGKFFGRIDQDTLIGPRFIDWFYDEYHEIDLGFDWPLVAFSGRRNLSAEQSLDPDILIFDDNRYREVEICHPNNHFSRVVPNGKHMMLFYGGAVGIMIVERNLYDQHKGFNEDFVYMNNMDTEFMNRLRHKNPFYNLGLRCDADFYHINHDRSEGAAGDIQLHAESAGSRPTNPGLIRSEDVVNKNPDDWGLDSENLEIHTF